MREYAVDLIFERLGKLEKQMQILQEQMIALQQLVGNSFAELTERVAHNEALIRRVIQKSEHSGRPSKYSDFVEWADELIAQDRPVLANEVEARFKVSRVTALKWLRQYTLEREGKVQLIAGSGTFATRVIRKVTQDMRGRKIYGARPVYRSSIKKL